MGKQIKYKQFFRWVEQLILVIYPIHMDIYIDESGVFLRNNSRKHSVSCIGSLIVPSRFAGQVESEIASNTADWPRAKGGELKGKLLDERHIATLCEMLEPFHVLLEVSAMDMNHSSDTEVTEHRLTQAELITKNLTNEFHPDVAEEIRRLRLVLEQMPNQLYAQFTSLNSVIRNSLQHGTLYFCQRMPGELANFRWVIDAKDSDGITPHEDWWRKTILPLTQSRSFREPFMMLKGGDYSAYRRNFPPIRTPEYLKEHVEDSSGLNCDLTAIIGRNLNFEESQNAIGLQLVDVLVNAVRRALSGRLDREGWEPIRRLMIGRKPSTINLLTFGAGVDAHDFGFYDVALAFKDDNRAMLTAR